MLYDCDLLEKVTQIPQPCQSCRGTMKAGQTKLVPNSDLINKQCKRFPNFSFVFFLNALSNHK